MRSLAAFLLILGSCAWSGAARAMEIDTSGITAVECLDPQAPIAAGLPRAVVCDVRNDSVLDDPIRISGNTFLKTRAGAYDPRFHVNYLNLARSELGEARYQELLALLLSGEFLRNESSSETNEWAIYQFLLACAEQGDATCQADADAMVAGKFEEAIPELLATRIDTGPTPTSLGLATSLGGFDANTLPEGAQKLDAIGENGVPAFFGGDRLLGTADDLPFIDAGGNGLSRVLLDGANYVGSTWALLSNTPTGLNSFTSVAAIDGSSDQRFGGQPVVLYGELNQTVAAFAGCQGLGGQAVGFQFGIEGFDHCLVEAEEIAFADPRLIHEGCENTRVSGGGGVNANARCIRLNLSGTLTDRGVHIDVLQGLSRAQFRPAGAAFFPEDLTDLVLFGTFGHTPPARPPNPNPGAVFPNVGSTGRRVDPDTGAPVRRTGPLTCLYRAADGTATNDPSLAVGPDGDVATEDDNLLPTLGNCLLWDDPTGPSDQQVLRLSADVAADHHADQTEVHAGCTFRFDPDAGACGTDQPNDPRFAQFIGVALASNALAGPALFGIQTLRRAGDPFAPEIGSEAFVEVLGNWDPDAGQPPDEEVFEVTPQQGALLGCGPGFGSACGPFDLNVQFGGDTSDGSAARALGIRGITQDPIVGPDFANADLMVLLQENSVMKGGGPGELVGATPPAQGDYFEAGISSGGLSPSDVRSLGPVNAAIAAGAVPTDAWVEPAPWMLDPDAADQGVIVYLAANQNELDPRCGLIGPDGQRRARDLDPGSPNFGNFEFTDEEASFCLFRNAGWTRRSPDSANIRNDPSDPTNPLNVFIPDYDLAGEICHPFMTKRTPQALGENAAFLNQFAGGQSPVEFDDGCTELERFSANRERLLIAFELYGAQRHFDPFETVDELQCWLDGDPSNDGFCDPVSGDDGIFTLNARVFNTEESDVQAVVNSGRATQTFIQAIGQNFNPLNGDNEDLFFSLYDPDSCQIAVSCHLQLNNSDRRRDPLTGNLSPTISALPLSTQGRTSDSGQIVRFSPLYLARKNPEQLARLFAGESVLVDTRTAAGLVTIRMDFSQRDGLLSVNLNNDSEGIRDLDENFDGVWDGADDFSLGPRALFSPLCGSGIPGDILQDAAQLELYSAAEEAEFAAAFPDGLPPRSPVFCASLNSDLGVSVPSAPGRREALWHIADADEDGTPDGLDGCPSLPNEDPTDTNRDGLPNVCQCGDWNDNGAIDNNDLTGISSCIDGLSPAETCDARMASGKAEANNNRSFDQDDLSSLFQALTGARSPGSLTCANRPEGTPVPR